jgi:hypothetical protein
VTNPDRAFFDSLIASRIEADRQLCAQYDYSFKERPAGKHHIGDFIGAVLRIDNEFDMARFYSGYLDYLSGFSESERSGSPEMVARFNIGWCFGEGMAADRIVMWSRVCRASHPVFGALTPTPEQAYEAGLKMGSR